MPSSQNSSASPSPFMPLAPAELESQMNSAGNSIGGAIYEHDFILVESEMSLDDYLQRASGLIENVEQIEAVVNFERESQSLPPLISLPNLRAIAFYRANDMVERDYLDHADPVNGTSMAEGLLIEEGYSGKLGELIWQSQSSLESLPDQAVEEWLSDPSQRRVINDPSFHYTGAGLIWDGSTWKIVQVFAETAP